MKHVKIITDRENLRQADELMVELIKARHDQVAYSRDTVDCSDRKSCLRAKKIVNEYAVTKLPFVVISDEDGEYAAVYSEEGPITPERVNAKL